MKSIFSVFFLLLCLHSVAQDIPANVNNISDGQLKEGLNKAQQQGYSQSQVEAMARAKGMSATEISTLRERIQKLQSEGGSSTIEESKLREELAEFELDFEDAFLACGTTDLVFYKTKNDPSESLSLVIKNETLNNQLVLYK